MASSTKKTRNIVLLVVLLLVGGWFFTSSEFFQEQNKTALNTPVHFAVEKVVFGSDGRRLEIWQIRQDDSTELFLRGAIFHPECELPTIFDIPFSLAEWVEGAGEYPIFYHQNRIILREKSLQGTLHLHGFDGKTGRHLWKTTSPHKVSDHFANLTEISPHPSGATFWEQTEKEEFAFYVLNVDDGSVIHQHTVPHRVGSIKLYLPYKLFGGGWMVPLASGGGIIVLNDTLGNAYENPNIRGNWTMVNGGKLAMLMEGAQPQIVTINLETGDKSSFPVDIPANEMISSMNFRGAWNYPQGEAWLIGNKLRNWIVRKEEGKAATVIETPPNLRSEYFEYLLSSSGFTNQMEYHPYVGELPEWVPFWQTKSPLEPGTGGFVYWNSKTDTFTEPTHYWKGSDLWVDALLFKRFDRWIFVRHGEKAVLGELSGGSPEIKSAVELPMLASSWWSIGEAIPCTGEKNIIFPGPSSFPIGTPHFYRTKLASNPLKIVGPLHFAQEDRSVTDTLNSIMGFLPSTTQ